jgi:polyphosphate kinase
MKKTVRKTKVKKILYHHRLLNPKHFFDRDISWTHFNTRVLFQAMDHHTPLLERIRFTEIFISNLDEFFMKRLGTVTEAYMGNLPYSSLDGKNPHEKILQIRSLILEQFKTLENLFEKTLLPLLQTENIYFVKWKELSRVQKNYLTKYFNLNIFPVLTPLSVDSGHPFPFISNLSKNLGVVIRRPGEKNKQFARIKIPPTIPQWIPVPNDNTTRGTVKMFINIEEIIINHLDILFTGMKIESSLLFRITRNALFSTDEGLAEDLLESIEEGLKERKFAPVIRLEHAKNPDEWIINFLKSELEIIDENIYEFACLPNYIKFKEIYNLPRPDLKYPILRPSTPHKLLEIVDESLSMFNLIKQKDMLIHHPYQSFTTTVERFIYEATIDPKVEAIKMTLYRTDDSGQIIDTLIQAAENGKQVVCVVELKARFEEEKNIRWAQKLESVGIHVIYGILGAKTHTKMALVVRREGGQLQSYVHIGTGNYNPTTAKIYEDLSYFTSKNSICVGVMEVFNHLTGKSFRNNYEKLIVAPFNMKSRFLHLIRREIENKKLKKPAQIIAKFNSLEDVDIINELYEASKAGVKISLVIRGLCCLRPRVKGLSDNIRVYSEVGRFLEHSRIYYFQNGKLDPLDGDVFIGSADWMHRNLENRVELIVPLEENFLKKKIHLILRTILKDNTHLMESDSQGIYSLPSNERKTPFYAHQSFIEHYSRGEKSLMGSMLAKS